MICSQLKECCNNNLKACAREKQCIKSRDNRKNVTCAEKKKRYNLINDKGYIVTQYLMDGGMIADEKGVQRCDYLYCIDDPTNPTAIFVELKGTDIPHAIGQIKASIDRYAGVLQRRVMARIVSKAVPRLYNDPIVKNLKSELKNRYRGNLVISEKDFEEVYSRM